MALPTMAERFDICAGRYIAALEWGHYGMITRMRRYYKPAPGTDTHTRLIAGGEETREAHRIYHVTDRLYARAQRRGSFDPYSDRMPGAYARTGDDTLRSLYSPWDIQRDIQGLLSNAYGRGLKYTTLAVQVEAEYGEGSAL